MVLMEASRQFKKGHHDGGLFYLSRSWFLKLVLARTTQMFCGPFGDAESIRNKFIRVRRTY